MESRKIVISPRAFSIVIGFFYIIFSIICLTNGGPVARTLAFPLLYLFGQFSYVLYALIIFLGFYRIIKGKRFKPANKLSFFAFILFLIGLAFAIGIIWCKTNNLSYSEIGSTLVEKYNEQLSEYYTPDFLNPFVKGTYWSNGVIFSAINGKIANDKIILILCIAFLSVSTLIELCPVIFDFAKNRKNKNVANESFGNENAAYDEAEETVLERVEDNSEEYFNSKEEPLESKVKIEEGSFASFEDEDDEPYIEPAPIEREPLEVKYGFEPEEDLPSQKGEFTQISLDEMFGQTSERFVEYNEFQKIRFNFKKKNTEEIAKNITENNLVEKIEEKSEVIRENSLENYDNYSLENNDLTNEFEEAPLYEESDKSIESDLATAEDNNEQSSEEIREETESAQEIVTENLPKVEVKEEKKKERVNWVPPSSELLITYETAEAIEANTKIALERMAVINRTLENFKIRAKCNTYTIGSSVTRFNIEYEEDVSVKALDKYISDFSRRLGGVNVRFTPIVEGEVFSGLEVPNAKITTVGFKEVFDLLPDVKKHPTAVAFGKDISGKVISADFDEFPHLLVAGTTGSGKSIYIHSIIATLIMRMSPDDLRVVLVDPKKVEMTKYRDMPHLLCPIITEAEKAKVMLSKLVDEMNDRYEKFAFGDDASNIKQYNEWALEHKEPTMPYIIVVLDEYADLVDTCKEISQPVVSIAQKARAAGIHLLISTQRPSTNVITGVIKGNLPTHVALMTSSYTDSTTILGESGAEKLLGKGDMLVQSPLVSRVGVTRLQGCFIQNREISHIVGYLKEHYETNYDENYLDLVDHAKEAGNALVNSGEIAKEANAAEEEKYQAIKQWVMGQQFVSMSKIQRDCSVGFNRAGRFFNRLQQEGIVDTKQDGASKGCRVLVHDSYYADDKDDVVTSDELIRY